MQERPFQAILEDYFIDDNIQRRQNPRIGVSGSDLRICFDLEVQRNMMEKIAGQFENCQKIENENIEKTGIGVPSPLSTLIGIKNFPGF